MQRTVALEFVIFLPRARTMSVQCLVGAGMLGAVLSVLGIMLPLLIRIQLRRLMRLRLLLLLLLLLRARFKLKLKLRLRLLLLVVLLLLLLLVLVLILLLLLLTCRPVRLGLGLRGVVGGDLDLVCNGDVDCRV
jgi:hypothetical protein